MGKIIKWSLIILVAFGVIGAIFGDDEEATKTEGSKAEVKKETVKPEDKPLNYKEVAEEVSREQSPWIYDEWGDDGVADINSKLLPAAETISKHKSCKNLEHVGFSEAYSVPKSKIVYFADCKGKDRVYLAADDIGSVQSVKTDRDIQKEKEEAKSMQLVNCQVLVKNSLKNPKSFDTEYSSIQQGTDPKTGHDVVRFKFYAQNSFGADLIHEASCSFNDKGGVADFVIQ